MESKSKPSAPPQLPYSFEERLLVRSSSSSTATSAKTVRLESLAQWRDDAWIHPFADIDIGLSQLLSSPPSSSSSSSFADDAQSLRRFYAGKIARVQMSVSSHGTRGGFPNLSDGLDGVPLLSRWNAEAAHSSSNSSSSTDPFPSLPQGFALSVRPAGGLTPSEEATAVQAVLEELIRTRRLVTPVTGWEWGIVAEAVERECDRESGLNLSPRTYELAVPLDGAAWSTDALMQAFQGTLPGVCRGHARGDSDSVADRFFGWSGKEWSDFLVGYYRGDGRETGKIPSRQHPTFHKVLWWTWTSSEGSGSSSNSSKNDNHQSLSVGIQYRTIVSKDASENHWLAGAVRENSHLCPIGSRSSFEVIAGSESDAESESENPAGIYRLVPLGNQENEKETEPSERTSPGYSHAASIDQVLRKHHTNRGRFESTIELTPLRDVSVSSSSFPSCRMVYRQVLPEVMIPLWRTLSVVYPDGDDEDEINGYYHNDEDAANPHPRLIASVDWDPEHRNSVLSVEAFSSQGTTPSVSSPLPSTIHVSLEFDPAFLTIDDFPGDPNKGWVIPPSRVTVVCEGSPSRTTIAYSNPLLLLPPVPDLSMPFNVVSLTCSLYAYLIGAIVTILVRKASEKMKYTLYPEMKPESKPERLRRRLREALGRVRSKLSAAREEMEEEEEDASAAGDVSDDNSDEAGE
mmetsp:Transcript_725/g.1736  ORF Transcript_725/g.1736 Transcript_725/m.1736 type:complete len:687 (+) Transcript_725:143-2203(+)|eukprot:CAMPEP_0172371916 /NCGR_PEP_ID=MMETSP1060-20121228/45356_1 /TAXON_ID=37318 /ORGANISM="Pseudo-nitzschia pungens, Strain cf. cingulata" /LENGTH=686 /DNA_ID=CAMNT_0013097691 /DNA_START=133 /DNA_END=2193 /DNA_ORIENTATION=-